MFKPTGNALKQAGLVLSEKAGPVAAKVNPHLPLIFTVSGVLLMGAGAILSALGTKKAMEHHQEYIEAKVFNENLMNHMIEEADGDVSQVAVSDLAIFNNNARIAKRKFARELIVDYLPTVACTSLGAFSTLYGHHILDGRFLAAVSLATAAETKLASYRERVVEKYGELADKRFLQGEIERKVTYKKASKNGKIRQVTKTISVADPEGHSEWAVMWKYGDNHFDKRQETIDRDYMNGMEKMLNRQCKSYGHVFMNDIYKQLGIYDKRGRIMYTEEGQLAGYIYDPEDPNQIIITMDRITSPEADIDSADGYWLDFPGVTTIIDKI